MVLMLSDGSAKYPPQIAFYDNIYVGLQAVKMTGYDRSFPSSLMRDLQHMSRYTRRGVPVRKSTVLRKKAGKSI